MKATRQQEMQILKALNQQTYIWLFRYKNDPYNTPYKTKATESNFNASYKNTIVIQKELL